MTKDQVFVELIAETTKSIANIAKLGAAFLVAQKVAQKIQQVFAAGLELAKLGAAAEQTEQSFRTMARNIGADADEVLAGLTRMSGGTIAQMDLMASASRAALFNLPMDKMTDLMGIARAAAMGTGQSVKQMFDDIVLGISRGSPMILDNLGITVKIEEANQKYAASIGKVADQLTAEERKQAMMNAVLEAGGAIIDKVGMKVNELTAAQKWEALQAQAKDFRTELGKYMLPAFESVTAVATKFVGNLKDIVELRNRMRELKEGVGDTADELAVAAANYNELVRQSEEMAKTTGVEMYVEERKALYAVVEALTAQKYWEDQVKHAATAKNKAAVEAAKKATVAQEAQAAALKEYLAKLAEEFAKTPEGQKAALESAIAYWEGHLKTAKETAPEIQAILRGLYDQMLGDADIAAEAAKIQADAERELIETTGGLSAAALGLTGSTYALGESMKTAGEMTAEDVEAYEKMLEMQERLAKVSIEFNDPLSRQAAYFKQSKEAAEEGAKALEKYQGQAKAAVAAVAPFADAIGMMAIDSKKGWEMFADAAKGAIAKVLEMLAEEAFVRAAIQWAKFLALDFSALPGAIAWSAAGTAALVAAGVVKGLAEGGIVTKPMLAMVGERGPEAVVPLGKAGGFGGTQIIVHVHGSVMAEEGLARRIGSIVARQRRGY